MPWEASLTGDEVLVGAVLCVYSRDFDGQPVLPWTGNHSLEFETRMAGWIQARVENAREASATLVMPDGVRYAISPWQEGDPQTSFILQGLTTRDWVVRSQVV